MPHVDISAAAGLSGYLAEPTTADGPWPGVVVVMDAFGLGDDIRRQADRLAAAGYLAVAPDLFARGGMLRCVASTLRASRTGEGAGYDDIDTTRRYLLGRPGCSGRIGIIGFCMGGGFAMASVWQFPFDASSVNYGAVPRDISERLHDRGGCPVVGSFGARDWTLRGHPERLERALTAAGLPHDVKVYPGVGHGFMNRIDAGPLTAVARAAGFGYDHAVAEDAWSRILTFFDEHLRSKDD